MFSQTPVAPEDTPMRRSIASLAICSALTLGLAAPAIAAPPAKPVKVTIADKDQAFRSFLDQLVAKGTITDAQAQAIADAMKERKAERQARMEAFADKADALVAAYLGMSVEKFREARASRTLPALSADQKAQIRAKLDALAVSMGLPKAPKASVKKN
jgi:polyhydroxyalkanoate synthesis regulator phasin